MSQRKVSAPAPPAPDTQPLSKPPSSKWTDLWIRLLSGFALVGGQLFILAVGPSLITLEMIGLAYGGYYECLRINFDASKDAELPSFLRAFPYITFGLFIFVFKGLWLLSFISDPTPFADYHYFVCYCLGAVLVLAFVLHLNPSNMEYSYHRLIPVVFGTVAVIIPAVLYGMLGDVSVFWFYTAASMIVQNDSAAYFCGRNWGKHRLIALSPSKTVEGFVGALLWNIFAGYFQPLLFAHWPFSYCSGVKPFDFRMKCSVPYYWVKTDFVVFGKVLWQHYPVQLHSLVLGLFAGLIAPFGGFLASGLKRCCNLKDFGNIIPGHGGILDRMDCELVMGSFAILYLNTFVLK
jgi:phosphatidate cytidylyltransferase